MATRTSQPAGGALLISELKEFASFPKATQRYIRRSLDVAYGRSDPLETWARDEIEAAAIAAQARFYKQLDHLRVQIPDDSGLDMIEPFLGMLVTLAAFDLGQDRLPNFAAFRFLYERLLGAGVRPWLPAAFCAAAALPHLHPGSPPRAAAVDQRKRRDRAWLVHAGAGVLAGVGREGRPGRRGLRLTPTVSP